MMHKAREVSEFVHVKISTREDQTTISFVPGIPGHAYTTLGTDLPTCPTRATP